jgi:hypothetical protein
MSRKIILFLFAVTTWILSFGQKNGDYYVSVDSLKSLQFRLLSDSTIEFSTIGRHMSPSVKEIYNYLKTDTTIEITSRQSLETDTLKKGILFQFPGFEEKISLTKINGGFIDTKQSLIYVRQKDFGKNPDIAYIIDGKSFFQDIGETDGYGLLKRKPKRNIQLQRKLKGLTKDNCDIEIVKGGLSTYRRFGLKYVYGAVVITTRK